MDMKRGWEGRKRGKKRQVRRDLSLVSSFIVFLPQNDIQKESQFHQVY